MRTLSVQVNERTSQAYLPVGVLRGYSKVYIRYIISRTAVRQDVQSVVLQKKVSDFPDFSKNTPGYFLSHNALEALHITIHAAVKNRNVMFY